jgi:hypothetical protein
MSKVLVIELPDDADLAEAAGAVARAFDRVVDGTRVYAAIREDAEAVLRVSRKVEPPDPEEQEAASG